MKDMDENIDLIHDGKRKNYKFVGNTDGGIAKLKDPLKCRPKDISNNAFGVDLVVLVDFNYCRHHEERMGDNSISSNKDWDFNRKAIDSTLDLHHKGLWRQKAMFDEFILLERDGMFDITKSAMSQCWY
ncbi:hypothetical protein IEQ34_008873 [Dendrobium chrysotoxum]|uniref:Uncharacterized protein n=1 Tax=Dendrobium chrysotoxum TaxID=161865 RepID=A0AAV7H089_DENCH|nr:hypothetical protein IEQ34_008873 [Dendrobium chrysotoxum]